MNEHTATAIQFYDASLHWSQWDYLWVKQPKCWIHSLVSRHLEVNKFTQISLSNYT